ncbi:MULTISPECIES: acyl carrier protein [Streptomyces]|uniref:Methoxymalonate biosynthesis protein n=1 Tax=Streptomyces viridosporus (strain ATCC 14672 / DSM 40746 / JCM 4963 / KCTC 9882 / NRRL B-12104 / FH 1290) TaxID=566461 RepID=D5ZTZ4_STRV1|nr:MULTISPECIES: acyl carrier protein [Streptomyces]EFE64828.1 methoxymalonate biosynthesis protein [Streptomyces viridosporus ATCC 14672]PWJ05410.1 acyl carrier protein [Streptomyces sp. NWU49]
MTAPTDRPTDIQSAILAFIEARTRTSLEPDVDIFAAGGLSSLFAMELVVHLEKTFGISIGGADMRLENFRTVDSMVQLVTRLGGSIDA